MMSCASFSLVCRTLAAAIVCATLAVVPRAAGAQTLSGRVVDGASGHPLAGAVIVLGGRRANADTIGRFVMSRLIPGKWRISLRSLGYTPFDSLIDLESYDTTRVEIKLIRLGPLLDTVNVTAPADVPTRLVEFEARRARKLGRYITPVEMRKNDERGFADVLRRLPGLGLQEGDRGIFLYSPTQQPPGALRGNALKPCYVQIVLDGVSIYQMGFGGSPDGPPDVSLLVTRNFDAVEYYSSPSRTPPEFRTNGATCGTLVLWSRRK